jgi:very-short-patch-repair endonuclease
VEVDGGQHGFAGRAAADATRSAWLSSRGYRVLRFWNNDVLGNLDGVLTEIEAAISIAVPQGSAQ